MIRFGIVGCGAISGVHGDSIESIPEAAMVACCDIDEKKGLAFAEKYHCEYFKNYEDLINSDVDVVTIATPHYLHKEMTIAALNAGKNVLCEKPMSISVEEADDIIKASEHSTGKYVVCFQNRFNDSFITLKRMISSGKLGKLKGLKCELTWKRDAAYYGRADWKGKWTTEGGGVLINQAIHTLDSISWLVSQPATVKGKIMTSLLEGIVEVEDAAMAMAKLVDGTPIVIFASNDYSSDPLPTMTFDFEKAEVFLTMAELKIDGKTYQEQEIISEENKKMVWGNGHRRFIQTYVNQLLGIEDNLAVNLAGKDGRNSIELLTKIYKSSANNTWENLS